MKWRCPRPLDEPDTIFAPKKSESKEYQSAIFLVKPDAAFFKVEKCEGGKVKMLESEKVEK